MDDIALSFIIPAYNERQYLPRTLDAIRRHVPDDIRHEVIVVDHGSTDGTPRLAEELGARVIEPPAAATVGALRNAGAAASFGRVLVFLDADMRLTPDWSAHIGGVLRRMHASPRLMVGSLPDVPEDASWLERTWFAPRSVDPPRGYLPTGHLLCTRVAFSETGGFDEQLETGEDYEFSMRARSAGMALQPDQRLRVIHDGYPGQVRSFVQREIWHGRGDFASVETVLASRVAVAALAFLALHLMMGAALGFGLYLPALVSAVAVAGLTAAGSYTRFRRIGPRSVLLNIPLFYLYLTGRALSFVQTVLHPGAAKRSRESGAA